MNGAGLLALMIVATIFLYFALTRDGDGDPRHFDAWYDHDDYKDIEHRKEGLAALERIYQKDHHDEGNDDGGQPISGIQ